MSLAAPGAAGPTGDAGPTGGAGPVALQARVRQLEAELALARSRALLAHRDSARLSRCLEALAAPAADPEELLGRALETLADAFGAEVACQVRGGVTGAAGTPSHVAVFSRGFAAGTPRALPDLPVALALSSLAADPAPRATGWSSTEDPTTTPLVVGGVEVRSAARLVPDGTDQTSGAVLLLRTDPTPFTADELHQLASLCERLLSASRAAEGRRCSEVLARVGRHLGGHRSPLAAGTTALLRDLTGGDRVDVVELTGDRRTGRAEHGVVHVHDLAADGRGAEGRGARLQGGSTRSLLRVPVLVDGEPRAVLVAEHDAPGSFSPVVVEAVGTFADVLAAALAAAGLYSALEVSEERSRHRATHDALTGLPNRTLVREELERRLAPGGRRGRVGVLFCDLDGFKSVNDRLGHDAGDQLLRAVTSRLQAHLRPGDLLARLGGDKFVVLVDDVPSEVLVEEVGQRLLAAVGEPYELVGQRGECERVAVGGCFGGAVSDRGPDAPLLASTLLRRADAAMYEAKRAGGHRVRTYDDASALASEQRSALAADLAAAVAAGSLEVHYQPVWDLLDDRAVGVEALVRWEHPEQGRIDPEVFVGVAERTGSVAALGALVLERACRDLVAWGAAGSGLRLSVNASPAELRGEGYAEGVLVVLAAHGLPASRLALEVTERLPLSGAEVTQIRALRAAGVAVVVDDFGVGHSDLARLRSMPVDGLKIDRSLVAGLTTGPGARPLDNGLVEAIVTLARAGGLSVVAEGVETHDERDALVALGCRTVQGWLTGRPVPASELLASLAPPEA